MSRGDGYLMDNFYVYVWPDISKRGQYIYGKNGEYCFLYKPFYVGKGKGPQWKRLSGRNEYFTSELHTTLS